MNQQAYERTLGWTIRINTRNKFTALRGLDIRKLSMSCEIGCIWKEAHHIRYKYPILSFFCLSMLALPILLLWTPSSPFIERLTV